MKSPDDDAPFLLKLPEREDREPSVDPLSHPIWTANKARLIEEYLRLFVYITRHGTYIDGFAGPQKRQLLDMWAAKRVLESQRKPRRIHHYHFFESDQESFNLLEQLRADQPEDPERTIDLYYGDFNLRVHELLNSRSIRESEATFCLLDQRTFECYWSTVRALAQYKQQGRKIELFYFLASKWLARALKATKKNIKLEKWWGRADWNKLKGMSALQCANEVARRFKTELNYRTVKSWPIFRESRPGTVMYYMIHATDHDEAPALMRRAYEKAVTPVHAEQLTMFLLEDYRTVN